ncbi:hypothetical protein NLU13_4425 [Sarocladium strictum]|uniref:Zn(2)-C6 fungal-type domain-containing protein n=1 Tax=Sarocladium strictum TaxID=5046 RepID=A0AA39GIU8_SARSR|nr:hypothetical protein NLU13_4425 [Sarocladium strictum]
MLLYTRLAPPKVPKKRSRAGCSYCKEKKKKCDETRPSCARCVERGQDCSYEPVRPRQRRKRDATNSLSLDTSDLATEDGDHAIQSPISPGITLHQWQQQRRENIHDSFDIVSIDGSDIASTGPLSARSCDGTFDATFGWSNAGMPTLSAIDSSSFDLSGLGSPSAGDDDVEEVIRRESFVTPHTSYNPSLALIAPVSIPSPHLEFCAPAFEEFSQRTNRRALVDHFCNVLSHLIVFREEKGNPFQQLVLPLSQSSPAVMDAIYALASAHLEYRGVQNAEKSVYFHNQAIQGLARLIEQGGDVNRNELLAAIMLLVYYEVLVQQGRSNIVDGHLKGAMTIMSNSKTRTDPTTSFLERAFRFYDVITALSFGTAPLSAPPGSGALAPFPPLDSRGATSPVGSVDALLGMATSLWPIIHRLSNLRGLKDQLETAESRGDIGKISSLRTEFESSASAIQVALKQWQPVLPPDSVLARDPNELTAEEGVERGRLQSILNNALAYRHSAFVYLYRTIHDYPRNHAMVQRHAHVSLTHCVGTVSNEGPMGALLWPLFVAACEATSLSDRDLARQAFVAIDRRQGMTNIDRAWNIVQEVWRRADQAERRQKDLSQGDMASILDGSRGGDLWRRVSEDMGMTIVFG